MNTTPLSPPKNKKKPLHQGDTQGKRATCWQSEYILPFPNTTVPNQANVRKPGKAGLKSYSVQTRYPSYLTLHPVVMAACTIFPSGAYIEWNMCTVEHDFDHLFDTGYHVSLLLSVSLFSFWVRVLLSCSGQMTFSYWDVVGGMSSDTQRIGFWTPFCQVQSAVSTVQYCAFLKSRKQLLSMCCLSHQKCYMVFSSYHVGY